jgi:putative transposase
MLGISRWTGEGGKYRTVQRFFSTPIDWERINWTLIRQWFISHDDVFILPGDETMVTKSGKKTHGIDRFFSSIYQKVLPGVSFFTISLVSTKHRISFPISVQQIIRSKEKTSPEKQKSNSTTLGEQTENNVELIKKCSGRPKGSKNKNKETTELPQHLCFIRTCLKNVLDVIGKEISPIYFVLDGAFGNNNSVLMVKQSGLQLISKLHCNSAIYLPYSGKNSGRGRRKKYGDRVDFKNIPKKYLKETTHENSIQTDVYQLNCLHKLFSKMLNVVIIVKTNMMTNKRSHVILFSSDLSLPFEKLIDYYSLRFQIEFNFRDAKQYWGLEDFMNVKKLQVSTAVNLAFFMVNLSQVLMVEIRKHNPLFGVQDLKAYFRAEKYFNEILKLMTEKPDPILIQYIFKQIQKIGSINML